MIIDENTTGNIFKKYTMLASTFPSKSMNSLTKNKFGTSMESIAY